MPKLYSASVALLIEADSEAEAEDAVAEALRPLLQKYAPLSSILDWQYHDDEAAGCLRPRESDGSEFDEYRMEQEDQHAQSV